MPSTTAAGNRTYQVLLDAEDQAGRFFVTCRVVASAETQLTDALNAAAVDLGWLSATIDEYEDQGPAPGGDVHVEEITGRAYYGPRSHPQD